MPDYLLPCTCGKKTAVSTAQAGATIHCVCGKELHVPTMRVLGELESADAAVGSSPKHRTAWEDHHRTAFLLVLVSIACLGVAAYLWLTLPERATDAAGINEKGIAEVFDNASPAETLQFYEEEMKPGLVAPAIDPNEKPRRMMLCGIGLAVVLAAVVQAGALLVVLRRTRRRG